MPIDYSCLVASNIRRARKQAHLTQEQLAEMSGISAQHLSKIERNQCSPTVKTLAQIAQCLGVHPADLLDSSELDALLYIYSDLDR